MEEAGKVAAGTTVLTGGVVVFVAGERIVSWYFKLADEGERTDLVKGNLILVVGRVKNGDQPEWQGR
jgi:hypothetical protein